MDAVEQIIDDVERLFTKLEVAKLRAVISKTGMSEDDVKAMLLEMVEKDKTITFEDGKPIQS